jgi:hypothetical protein
MLYLRTHRLLLLLLLLELHLLEAAAKVPAGWAQDLLLLLSPPRVGAARVGADSRMRAVLMLAPVRHLQLLQLLLVLLTRVQAPPRVV